MGRMGRERYWSRSFTRGEKESAGCMSGMLQFFDFHQFQCFTQQQPYSCKADSLQGLEAPRNSLELEVDTVILTTTAVVTEEELPIEAEQHPGVPKSFEKDSSSDTSSLQGSKTPNLVARLMGLDLLPDQVYSPPMHKRTFSSQMRSRHSSKSVQRRDVFLPVKETTKYDSGIRSLPDTPRISLARRSDVDPRFSLQLNKESIDMPEFNYFSRSVSRDPISASSPFSSRKRRIQEGRFQDENKSPSSYAREIVKQVKESVSRRVGTDITNISSSSRNRSVDDSNSPSLSIKKAKKPVRVNEEPKPSKPLTSSSSPRLRFLDTKTKRIENREPISTSNSPRPSSLLSTISTSLPQSAKPKSKSLPKSTAKCKKASCERFTQRPFSPRRNCKSPFSNTLLVQIHPSSNAIKNPIQTVVNSPLPSGMSQKQQYEEQQQKRKPALDDRDDRVRTTVTDGAEFRYIRGILERTGVERNTALSVTRWFSPAHPVDPTVFLDLERSCQASTSGPLIHRCNRRLLFNLVDEFLHYDLKTQLRKKPWLETRNPLAFLPRLRTGEQILGQLLSQLRSFPSTKCETLQDIDGLVGFDLSNTIVRQGVCYSAVEEEGESIVFELEREIFDSLVQEALLLLLMVNR